MTRTLRLQLQRQPKALPKSPSLHFQETPQISIRLMSVTQFDATLKGVDGPTAAEDYKVQVEKILRRSRRERDVPNLLGQIGISLTVIFLLLGV